MSGADTQNRPGRYPGGNTADLMDAERAEAPGACSGRGRGTVQRFKEFARAPDARRTAQ